MQKTEKAVFAVFLCLAALVLVLGAAEVLRIGRNPNKDLGTVRLNVQTYPAGKNQLTHPSVLSFPEEWNGARFWMAYTPYPEADGDEENPSIAVSNDFLYWYVPVGMCNPVADNEETGCSELKDPHLVYRKDLDRLELWYLGRVSDSLGGDGQTLLLMRKCSPDGRHWGEMEIMSPVEYLSPSLRWDGQNYQMWSIGFTTWGTEETLVYQESPDGHSWTAPVPCSIGGQAGQLDIWHGGVTFADGLYRLCYIDISSKQEVFYAESEDGVHFGEPVAIVHNDRYWRNLYRPVLLYDKDLVTCIYGVVNYDNRWYITFSRGHSETDLTGLHEDSFRYMRKMTDDPGDARSLSFHLRLLNDGLRRCARIEVFLLLLPWLVLLAFRRIRSSRWFLPAAAVTCLPLSGIYLVVRTHPNSFPALVSMLFYWLIVNAFFVMLLFLLRLFLDQRKTKPNKPV